MKGAKERRSFRRHPIRLPISCVSSRLSHWLPIYGDTVDVNEKGVRLHLSAEPDLRGGDPVNLRLSSSKQELFLTVNGRVRWVRSYPGWRGEWEIGVCLEQDELSRWKSWLNTLKRVEIDPSTARSIRIRREEVEARRI